MNNELIYKELSKPFPEEDLEFRIARAGLKKDGKPWAMYLTYIDARAVMDRLDSVVGFGNWQDKYRKESDAVICSLSLKLNNEWVTKEDACEVSDIEPVKGAISGAIKRAAVKFSIGRYLYHLTENFAVICEQNTTGARKGSGKTKEGQFFEFYWKPQPMPAWALPTKEEETKSVEKKTEASTNRLSSAISSAMKAHEVKKPELIPSAQNMILEMEMLANIEGLQKYWSDNFRSLPLLNATEREKVLAVKDELKAKFSLKNLETGEL